MKVAARVGLLMLLAVTVTATQLDRSQILSEINQATAYARQYVPNVASAENQELAKKAVALFETVLAKDPQNVEALSGLAGIYQSTLDYSRARDIYLRLTRIEPQNPVHFYNAGSTNWILAYDKQNPLPAANRARVIDEGLENLAAALRLNPLYDEAMTYTNLLLRQKALITTDPIESARLLNEADQWFQNALATRSLNRPAGGRGIAGGTPLPPPPPPPPPLPPSLVRSQAVGMTQLGADVAQRNLITRVEPTYPPLVLRARFEADVILQTTINKLGDVVDVKVVSGNPLVNEAAIEAVKQWKYRPYLVNGQPIDVTTTVVVNFSSQ
jgi:TonB family protein